LLAFDDIHSDNLIVEKEGRDEEGKVKNGERTINVDDSTRIRVEREGNFGIFDP